MACPYIKGNVGEYECTQKDRKKCLKKSKETQLKLTPQCFVYFENGHRLGCRQ